MSTLSIAGVVLAAIVAAALLAASSRPDTFRITRSGSMKAPPERVFAQIDDFRAWGAWSPWEKIDPNLKRDFSGAARGKGAVYAWEGNKDVGSGRMEILEAVPSSRVSIKLDFLKPFEAHNAAEFQLAAEGGVTTVTWTMTGPSPFFMKVMGLFMDMDKMIGKEFEKGLANLKAVTEAK